MKYSQAIFGKDLYDLTYHDLEVFFSTEKEETLNLEFKSYGLNVKFDQHVDKEKVIKKSVCALLNSEGGIIVWGAPVETKDINGNRKTSGALTPFDAGLDRDKLVNSLTASIIPMPIGIRVQFLKGASNNSIIIIEVEKSIERPHQYDNRYFVRLDGQTWVAPHYLIKALIQGKDFPILRGHIKLRKIATSGNNIVLTFTKLLYNTSQFNNEINAFVTVIAYPGSIVVNGLKHSPTYDEKVGILTQGRPVMSDFAIYIPSQNLNEHLKIGLQFGGEKSPSKISNYEYNLSGALTIGNVSDENAYLIEKSENKLPSEITNNDDDTINALLNM